MLLSDQDSVPMLLELVQQWVDERCTAKNGLLKWFWGIFIVIVVNDFIS